MALTLGPARRVRSRTESQLFVLARFQSACWRLAATPSNSRVLLVIEMALVCSMCSAVHERYCTVPNHEALSPAHVLHVAQSALDVHTMGCAESVVIWTAPLNHKATQIGWAYGVVVCYDSVLTASYFYRWLLASASRSR